MKSILAFSTLTLSTLSILLTACSSDKSSSKSPQVVEPKLNIEILNSKDSSLVESAEFTVYDANSQEAVGVFNYPETSDLILESGFYYITVQAQGFESYPLKGGQALPFEMNTEENIDLVQPVYLTPIEGAEDLGTLTGSLSSEEANILVFAQMGNQIVTTNSNENGEFSIYNLPKGEWSIFAQSKGLETDTIQVQIEAQKSAKANLKILNLEFGSLSGSVSFLATNNDTVSVKILNIDSKEAIPGLSSLSASEEMAAGYSIDSIPNGEFLAWASLENDGLVMDPDWIRKNPDALNLNIQPGEQKEINFSVTGAISMNSPTNADSSLIPDTLSQSDEIVFSWQDYPSTKEYIIEVFNQSGERIWGGFDQDGNVFHEPILRKSGTSLKFNFDGSASEELIPGEVYQWKIYADSDDEAGVQGLISSSEDLKGLFVID